MNHAARTHARWSLAARAGGLATAATLALCGAGCRANESFGSEFSHFVAGAGVASAATVAADHFGAGNRGWVGFGTAVAVSFVLEGVQIVANGREQLRPSALDFGSNLAGAALGAWVTDRLLVVTPVLTRDAAGHRGAGVALAMPF